MRFLLIALLLANLALFLYMQSGETPPPQLPPPVAADKIVLLKPLAEGEPVPTTSAPLPEPETACLEWGPLADTQLDNARAALNRIPGLGAFQEIRRQGPARSWLVSLDGFDNRGAAVNRANELRRQNINDVSVLEPESGPGATFTLSLGIFSSEQGAESRVAALTEKKINGVKITPRASGTAVFFVVANPSPALEQQLRELLPRFADSTVQSAVCLPPQTS
ncbi:MAG: hypothetical protein LBE75_04835 [Burkholderiales bacterium]|jgi:hypothetical protein|nr:hypothetical protein [Burkholderiales bacterium]